jgi:AcrR family transcriptional regulator
MIPQPTEILLNSSKGGSRRNTQKYKQKQTEILATAARIFNENGLKDTTIATLAASVDMTFANLTYYFKRKDDLVLACYRYAFGELNQIIAKAQQAPTPFGRLKVFLELYFAFQQKINEKKANPLLDFGYITSLSDLQRSELDEEYRKYFRSMRELIRPDHLDPVNKHRLNSYTLYLTSQLNWFGYWLANNQNQDYNRLANRLLDILAFGAGPEDFKWSKPESIIYEALSKSKQIFLKAATELINMSGYRGASVERIAAGLGRTKGSFYHHYKNKDELVAACYDRTFAMIDDTLARAGKAGNHRDRLNNAISNLVRFQLDPSGPLLHTNGLMALTSSKRVQFEDKFQQLSDNLTNIVIDGIIDDSIRPIDPIIAALMLIPTIFSASELSSWFPEVANPENAAELFVQPFLKGILQY